MAKLTFYGGVNEIGGNKILLEDNGTRIFLDFGMSFTQAGRFFSEFLQPRKCGGLADFFEFGLLPDLEGLYRRDYLRHMGRKPQDTEYQAILLSHAHADHAAYIHHLRKDIPIFCSEPTHAILKALNDTSRTSFSELTELVRCFGTYVNKKGDMSKKTKATHPDIVEPRKFHLFEFGKKFKIDNLEVIPYNVDHSLPGATGFIIHTSSGTVVYTGDFRFHGRREERTEQFLEACKKEKPDVLVIEGTRVDEESSKKESDLESEVSMITSKAEGLTVCNWPVRDTDRMMSFLNAAKRVGKNLAIDLKQAYLIEQLRKCKSDGVILPDLDDENLKMYAMRKTWGLVGSDWAPRLIRMDYDKWEREYVEHALNHKDVRDNQEDYMFFCNNFELKELIDLQPVKGSVYIKSVCEPIDIEMETEWKRVKNWIDHFGMELRSTHVSGHASGPQLKSFTEDVSPKMVVPVHTQRAEIFDKWWENTSLLKGIGGSVEIR